MRIVAPHSLVVSTLRQPDDLMRSADRQGSGAMLVARLLPIIAFNLINYAAALAGIGWQIFP
jgi:uncharacterized membrane protein YdjX (TVP38/TMEM64 family)